MDNPILSLVVIGRNDNYGGLFQKRLALCLNYLSHGLTFFKQAIDVEFVVLDWNSEIPLSDVITLTPEASERTRFLAVPPRVAHAHNPEGIAFHTTKALNTGIRWARGEYFLFMPADILFTHYSLERLWGILEGRIPIPFSLNESVMAIKRYIIPYAFQETQKSFSEIDRYLTLSTNWFPSNHINPGILADAGAILCHRRIWEALGGFDERMAGWGKSDSRFGFSANIHYPTIELSGTGICCYDPSIDLHNVNTKTRRINEPRNIDFLPFNDGPGLPQEELIETTAVHQAPAVPSSEEALTLEALQTLFSPVHTDTIRRHLPFNAQWIKPYLYPIAWYASQRPITTFCEVVSSAFDDQNADFDLMEQVAPALVSALNPSAEIISILPESRSTPNTTDFRIIGREYFNKKGDSLSFTEVLQRTLFPPYAYLHKWHPGFTTATHQGPVHYILGHPDSAFERIQKRAGIPQTMDLVLFRPTEFKAPEAAFAEATKWLHPLGLLIIDDPQGKFLIGDPCQRSSQMLHAPKQGIALFFKTPIKMLDKWWQKEGGNENCWRARRLWHNQFYSWFISIAERLRRR